VTSSPVAALMFVPTVTFGCTVQIYSRRASDHQPTRTSSSFIPQRLLTLTQLSAPAVASL